MSVLATRSAADPPVNGCSTTAIQDESGAQSTAEPIIFEASLYERAFGFRTVHNKDTSSPLPAHGPHVETGSPTSHGTQNADLHQAGPGYYVPWLPRQDDAGVLSALHERAFLVFFFSTCAIVWTGAMVFLVLTMAQWNVGMVFIRLVGYFTELFNILRGAINWFPMFLVYNIWRRLPEDRKTQRWLAFIVALGLFLFFAWVNHKLSKSDSIFEAWQVNNIPQSFRGCRNRVAQHQSMLFTPGRLESSHSNSSFGRDVFDRGVYHVQFDRIHVTMKNLNSTNWVRFFWIESLNATQFQEIHGNQTLCSQGFQGDSDYYGIGIRGGLYLQWAGSLLANNFLPSSRTELQKVYLVFSLAICIATMVTTLSATCTFSIEIEILYWMYWGGYICVFGSAPDTFVLGPQTGPKTKWVHLDWTTAIVFITHMAMTYHGSWFVWYAYDSFFARWPCGTYQFFLAPLFDPSEAFSRARDLLTVLWLPVVPPLLMVFPFLALLLATEVKHTIQHAAVFGLVFHRHDAEVAEADMNAIANRTLCQRVYKKIEIGYGILRSKLRLPPHARKGIRLITSVDIKHRR